MKKSCFAYMQLKNGDEICGALSDTNCRACYWYKSKSTVDSLTKLILRNTKREIEKGKSKGLKAVVDDGQY